MDEMKIKSKIQDFQVKFVDDFDFIEELLAIPNYIVFVGSVVFELYKERLFERIPKEKLIVMELDEERKSIETVINLYKKMMNLEGKKNLTLISFGGGINQDISGFVASTLYRGINWIYVPTTLLAMADSSIGLKTSLNFESVKNMIGTFYPPSQVFINLNFLKTLKKQDYSSGVGEIMKLLLMKEGAVNSLDEILEKVEILNMQKDDIKLKDVMKEAMQIKLSYMAGDEFDQGRRNLLNYGHELGHALEPVSDYEVPHGTAVVIGMIFANHISLKRGWIPEKTNLYINEKLFLPHIKLSMVKLNGDYFDEVKLIGNMKKDKKRTTDELVLVLPDKNFNLLKVQDLTTQEFNTGVRAVRKLLKV